MADDFELMTHWTAGQINRMIDEKTKDLREKVEQLEAKVEYLRKAQCECGPNM